MTFLEYDRDVETPRPLRKTSEAKDATISSKPLSESRSTSEVEFEYLKEGRPLWAISNRPYPRFIAEDNLVELETEEEERAASHDDSD